MGMSWAYNGRAKSRAKLHQAAPSCTKLHQAALSLIKRRIKSRIKKRKSRKSRKNRVNNQ
jgi:hypothetical protein